MSEALRGDLTYPLSCDIVNWVLENGHIEYEIHCERSIINHKWTIKKRYTDFADLNTELTPFGMEFELPPKKTFGNTKPEFVEARKAALQDFLDKVTVHPLLYCAEPVLKFLSNNGNLDTNELMQSAATSLRNIPGLVVTKRLNNNGWRYCKLFYQVICQQTKEMYIYSWLPYGPVRSVPPSSMIVIFDFLRKLKFPFFMTPSRVMSDRNGIGVLNDFKPEGSLRDQLYKKKPEGPFWQKYNVTTEVCTISTETARIIAKDVLEAMIALRTLCIPYTSVHCGNVMVTEEGCLVTEIEQAIAGQSSMHYPAMIKNKNVVTVEHMMVVNYGHFIYEMLTGIMVFPEHDAENALSKLPMRFQGFLRHIFTPNPKYGLPTLLQLANDALFHNIDMPTLRNYYLSMPLTAKKLLEGTMEKVGAKLTADKAAYNERRRREHFQELMQSDAERQRRKDLVLAQLRDNSSDNTK